VCGGWGGSTTSSSVAAAGGRDDKAFRVLGDGRRRPRRVVEAVELLGFQGYRGSNGHQKLEEGRRLWMPSGGRCPAEVAG
jgi:hypothetical protein